MELRNFAVLYICYYFALLNTFVNSNHSECDIKVDSSCFSINTVKSSFPDAENNCFVAKGNLARLDSDSKIDAVTKYMTSKNISLVYFGITDRAQRGTYRWPNGDVLLDRGRIVQGIWAEKNVETCLLINSQGQWIKSPCNAEQQYICEEIDGKDPISLGRRWSAWVSMDSPAISDQILTVENIRKTYPFICTSPDNVECQVVGTNVLSNATGNVFQMPCSNNGLICLNSDQNKNSQCQHYQLRFLCPTDIDECSTTGLSKCHQNAQCINTYGSYKCVCKAGFSGNGKSCFEINQCVAWGDPHYISYDQVVHHFMGVCSYRLTETCFTNTTLSNTLKPFQITTANEHRGINMAVSFTKSVSLKLGNMTVMLAEDNVLSIDGVTLSAPQTRKKDDVYVNVIYATKGLKITTSFGVEVLFDGVSRVTVSVPSAYANQMCGMCGNMNGDINDEWTLADGTNAVDRNLWGDSWMTKIQSDANCAKLNLSLPHNLCDVKSDPIVTAKCSILIDPNGPFKSCHALVDPQTIYPSCYFDLCSDPANTFLLCSAYEMYAEKCASQNILLDWRSATGCNVKCGANQHYVSTTSGCQASCDNPNAHDNCPLPDTSGCVCNDGFLRSGSACKPKEQCGCYDANNNYKSVGEIWFTDFCSTKNRCTGTNTILADPNVQCHKYGECFNKSDTGESECRCKAGFTGRPDNCTDVDECSLGSYVCSSDGDCVNVLSKYKCKCKAGFSGDGVTCTDINECAQGNATCSPYATCYNTRGGFECICQNGYEGSGFNCSKKPIVPVNEDQRGCSFHQDATCDPGSECTDLPNGNFSCTCIEGMNGDGLQGANHTGCSYPPCPQGVFANDGYCYVFLPDPANHTKNVDICVKQGGYLATFINDMTLAAITAQLEIFKQNAPLYIGYTSRRYKDFFIPIDLSLISSYKWASGQPKPGLSCSVILPFNGSDPYKFQSVDCTSNFGSICKFPSSPRKCAHGWREIGDKCITLFKIPTNVIDAAIQCSRFGGDLVRIQSSKESNLIFNRLLKLTEGKFWFGLNKNLLQRSSTAQYPDSDDMPFKNYNSTTNNNLGMAPDIECFQILSNGKWIGAKCDEVASGFLCEKPQNVLYRCPASSEYFNGECYKTITISTKADSETLCSGSGGHLVAITTFGEQAFLENYLLSRNIWNSYWIGLDEDLTKASIYSWVDHSPFEYTHWGTKQPGLPTAGNCVIVDGSSTSQLPWKEVVCTASYPGICEYVNTPCVDDTSCHKNGQCHLGQCKCKPGFRGDGRRNCTNINECQVLANPCSTNEVCADTEGSFVCNCLENYVRQGTGSCQNKLYCLGDADCAKNGKCFNSLCACNLGFNGDGKQICSDINECQDKSLNNCNESAICTNLVPSYKCECKPGYEGNGISDCHPYPKNCHEYLLRYPTSKSGVYTIDPDGIGPLSTIDVSCEMRPNLGITRISHDSIVSKRIKNRAPFSEIRPITYEVPLESVVPIINTSGFCYQDMEFRCQGIFSLIDTTKYVDVNGKEHRKWGSSTTEMQCGCGEINACGSFKRPCICDGVQNSNGAYDTGRIIDKTILPLTKIITGGIVYSSYYGEIKIGELRCGPRPFDLPKNCHDAKTNYNVIINGATWIDVDGDDSLLPMRVFCDVETKRFGVTILPHDKYPGNQRPYLGTVFPGPLNDPISPNTEPKTCLSYPAETPQIMRLIADSPSCFQEVQYTCQKGAQLLNNKAYFQNLNGVNLNYFASGTEGKCNCGVYGTCSSGSNCNCDGNNAGSDFGFFRNKNDLPIKCIFDSNNSPTPSNTSVGALICAPGPIGLEPSCHLWFGRGYTANYTYLIDPDGGNINNDPKNINEFLVDCVMNPFPLTGITVIPGRQVGPSCVNETDKLCKITVDYPLTPDQIKPIISRSAYCQQHIKYDCRTMTLLKPYVGKRNPYSYWQTYSSKGTGPNRSYYAGNGTKDATCQCGLDGSCDTCLCDVKSDKLKTDSGYLTKKTDLPVGAIWIGQDSSVANLISRMDLGPLQCFETFPTCELGFYGFSSTTELWLFYSIGHTLDPDGPLGDDPITAKCDGRDTVIYTEIPAITIDDSNSSNIGPNKKCMDIKYVHSPSTRQIKALTNLYTTCKQYMKLSCKSTPLTNYVTWYDIDGKLRPGWAGNSDGKECACGEVDSCRGGKNFSCNCDLMSTELLYDHGLLVNKDILPVSKICVGLTEKLPPPGTKRQVDLIVQELICSYELYEVYPDCQRMRENQYQDDYRKFDPQSEAWIIDPDLKGPGKPFTVYCDMKNDLPVGITVLNLKPDPLMCSNSSLPKGKTSIDINYLAATTENINNLISVSSFCEQMVTYDCQDAPLLDGIQYGAFDRSGNYINYWIGPNEKTSCTNVTCNCAVKDGKMRSDSGKFVDKSRLPLSKIALPSVTGTRKICVSELRCYNLPRTCEEYNKQSRLDINKGNRNNIWAIDPDQEGKEDYFGVLCKTVGSTIVSETLQTKNPQLTNSTDSTKSTTITYTSGSVTQIQNLITVSSYCSQKLDYFCIQTGTLRRNGPTLRNSKGDPITSWVGADFYRAKDSCGCNVLGMCPANEICRCDALTSAKQYEGGIFTDRTILPITQITYTSNQNLQANIYSLDCASQPFGLPKDCIEARTQGYVDDTEVIILPTGASKPYLVSCQMSAGPNKKMQITIVPTVKDTQTNIFSYPSASISDIQALVKNSVYCLQPMKMKCQGIMFSSIFSYIDGSGVQRKNFGTSNTSPFCQCRIQNACAGIPGESRASMLQRNCSCDTPKYNVNLADAAIITDKSLLPITSVSLSLPKDASSSNDIKVGPLLCSNSKFDFDECQNDFHDCDINADCSNTNDGFKCTCKAGWQGLGGNEMYSNGRSCIDDDECALLKCPSVSKCTNTPGSFKCFCNTGYRQTGPTTCIDIDECATNSSTCDTNARCVNTDGSYLCACNPGFRGSGYPGDCEAMATCGCWGDPHCLSFDGKWLHYQGKCKYTMVRDGCEKGIPASSGSPSFEVIMKNWDQNQDPNEMVSWAKEITVKLMDYTIMLKIGFILTVNGQKTSIPFSPKKADGSSVGFNVSYFGSDLRLTSVNGLEVRWDGASRVDVAIPGRLKEKVCGLCGNYNSNPNDDWIIGPRCKPSGNTTDLLNLFGDSWQNDDPKDPDCESPTCKPIPNETPCAADVQTQASLECKKLIEIFSKCEEVMKNFNKSLDEYIQSCIYDRCHTKGDLTAVMCRTAETLAQRCQEKYGVTVKYRNENFCNLKCKENMTYSTCGSACPQTCYQTNLMCMTLCVEGCFCNPGYVMENGNCIKPGSCGCLMKDGTYYTNGEKRTNRNCTERCGCNPKTGQLDCVNITCSNDAFCDFKDDDYGCHCKNGFMGDGINCKDIDECAKVPKVCGTNAHCNNTQGSYKCKCDDGFEGNGITCTNINECSPKSPCQNVTEECFDKIPGYLCKCADGFMKNVSTGKCEDKNECADTGNQCDRVSTNCNNTFGSYRCECKYGFRPSPDNSFVCIDVNECNVVHECDKNYAKCTNTPGSYYCTCNYGYRGDGWNCTDIDECSTGKVCPRSDATCVNLNGSYQCLCPDGSIGCEGEDPCNHMVCKLPHEVCLLGQCLCTSGYERNNSTGKCSDVDECKTGRHDCAEKKGNCTNLDGGYDCQCLYGYRMNPTTKLCENINECQEKTHRCGQNAECVDTDGGYFCQCSKGYTGHCEECHDIDECALSLNECDLERGRCENSPGSFKCICSDGYAGDGISCKDVDECKLGTHNCTKSNQFCVNTNGAFKCLCLMGYSMDKAANCVDNNECLYADNGCHENAKCTNTEGSFKCVCQRGYVGSGKKCVPIDGYVQCGQALCPINGECRNGTCFCKSGYQKSDDLCININECLDQTTCDINANCLDTLGSFICTCNDGYFGDGIDCFVKNPDVDICKMDSYCLDGSCYDGVCHCPEGFTFRSKRCYDERCQNACPFNAICSVNSGSVVCSCSSGTSLSSDKSECLDIDECVDNIHDCQDNSQCLNRYGSYDCKCSDGYLDVFQDGKVCKYIKPSTCTENCPTGQFCDNGACACLPGLTATRTNQILKCTKPSNSCQEKTCPMNSECEERLFGYLCHCNKGYEGVGQKSCDDINECAHDTHNCTENEYCNNLPGSFSCSCKEGFSRNETTNKCESQVKCRCGSHGLCTTDLKCICKPGFEVNHDGACEDIDECKSQSPCHMLATCTNTIGSFQCKCPENFFGDPTIKCIEDKCKTKTLKCPPGQECSNSLFGSVCVKKKCNVGDILVEDECVPESKVCQSVTCGRNAVCRIENGRPDCFCDSGYSGDGETCENINECLNGTVICPENSRCQDREGSYSCTCNVGFERSVNSSATDPCTDIDECQISKSCANNAKCTNSIGSFKCECNPGYIGDAKYNCQLDSKCERMNKCHKYATCAVNVQTTLYECQCDKGYSGDGITTCIKDNLCFENGVSKCQPNAQCSEANATYQCVCPTGFQGDGYNFCNDVDECADPATFHCSGLAKCKNKNGGYTCACEDGARLEDEICVDINECAGNGLSKCHQYSVCTNTPGSYTCQCNDGFFGDGVVCVDIDECLLGTANCNLNALCRNTPGSFACECQAGTIGNGTSCTDKDECEEAKKDPDAPQCDENAICKNTYPGFECKCKPGYQGTGWFCVKDSPCNTPKVCSVNETCSPSDDYKKAICECKPSYKRVDKTTCVAVLECENKTDTCDRDSSDCVQLERGYKCVCKTGFNAVGKGCEDKNECDPKSPDFAAQHCFASGGGCLNTKGGFLCTCSAKQASDEKSGCRPIDYCATKMDNCDRKLEICISGSGSSYICQCIKGYEKSSGKCVDIDECKEGTHLCKGSATCTNTPGSYTCSCPSNLRLDESKLSCTDRNECFENPLICGDFAKCVNLEGSYSCSCVKGYKWNGKTCEDIDECVTKTHPCHEYAECTNTPGACTCKCRPGYTGDGMFTCSELDSCPKTSGVNCPKGSYCNMVGNVIYCNCTNGYEDQKTGECRGGVCYSSCTDIDECVTNKAPCHHLAKCTNNAGGYACACPSFMDGDGKVTCEDRDECVLSTHTCNLNTSVCENLNNTEQVSKAFSCNCFTGFIKAPGSEDCVNENECINPLTNDCDQHSKCIDTEGSYHCQCEDGYRSLPNRKCADIDECVEKTDKCPQHSVCHNTDGSFDCKCSDGFQKSGSALSECSDIDECQNPTTCMNVPNSICVNNPGSFECACPVTMSNQGGSCLDTDECLIDDICGPNASCQNTNGGYNCTCKKGLRQLPNGDCETINECLEGVDKCKEFNGANSICFDLDVDYSCSCPKGYINNPSRPAQCEDLDECTTNTHNCPAANSKCVNTYGSFKCSCNPGFAKNAQDKCVDINECDTSQNKTDVCNKNKCTNTQGGYICECSSGYNSDNNQCQDIDECSVDPVSTQAAKCDPLNQDCVNTPGSYKCVCRKGFVLNKTTSICQDVNECGFSTSCRDGQCFNYPGTFQCICDNGFKLVNGKCIDIDECVENPTICGLNEAGFCVNEKGSYQCKCNTGYENSGGVPKNPCQVINECAKLNIVCPSNSQCVDRPKGYDCLCKDGYEEDEIGICRNINECQIENSCHYLANCTDTEGSYKCTCKFGYKGDGKVSCTDICDKDSCPKSQMCKVVNGNQYECGCQCQGDKCIESGQVCDTNGTTYLSVKQMFETNCKNQLEVEVEYYHECKKSCADVLCPGKEVCSMESGRPSCHCIECTEEDNLPKPVCTNNGIQFQSRCQMKEWVCSTKTQVDISYEGPCQAAIDCELSKWSEWSGCSKVCGIGSFSRKREIVKPARFNGNCEQNLMEIQDCFNGPCAGDPCEKMTCSQGSFCENGKCICPDCTNQVVADPVCGKIGDQQSGSFRTFCTLIHNACILNATYTYIHKGYCGDHVPAEPDVCSVVTKFGIVTLADNCTSTEPIRTNLCSGGCGKNPNYCCRPLTTRVLRVKFHCQDNSFVYREVKSIASCDCKLELVTTASP